MVRSRCEGARLWAVARIGARARGAHIRRIVKEIWVRAAEQAEEILQQEQRDRHEAALAARPPTPPCVGGWAGVRTGRRASGGGG